ncbi:MAG TPA: phosphatase PAP2 family protein [Steroidobacteraceae bacterium]|nr:phosphatase PAP2 family protein [Steroidobacteraceae bacterium]
MRDAHWQVELGTLVRSGFLRTTVSTSLLTGVFFIAYFFVQRHPAHPPVLMPRTALDLIIPFEPVALVAYVSLWIYIGVGPGLTRTVREFAIYGLWLGVLCIAGLAIFYFLPTRVPLPVLPATRFPGFEMLHRVDEASNACPSMHVAVAIFTVVRVDSSLRSMRVPWAVRLANLAWFMVIAYSTLAIKQHVVLDVVAGAVLGVSFAMLSLRWRPHSERIRVAGGSLASLG